MPANNDRSKLPIPIDPDNAQRLKSAREGFDGIFSNDILQARSIFASNPDPYHFLGLAVCGFLEAALGMESNAMEDAAKALATAEELARKQARETKGKQTTRFASGLEWEVLMADTTVLSALINVFSETYSGYFRCLLALRSAHAKFNKLYKTVFPEGVDGVPGQVFDDMPMKFESVEGPLEELIVSGTAFGYGVFNLALSILPKKIQRFVGWFGFRYDQTTAIQALAVAARKNDAHSVFAALVLMLYLGLVLQMTGWQADREAMMQMYLSLIEPISIRYPTGNLWTLYSAKLMRLMDQQDNAIAILQEGIKPGRVHVFKQADMLLVYELAWTLVGERRYEEAAEAFLKMKELNSWSHATYHFLAAGCYISNGKLDKGQSLLDAIPDLMGRRVAGHRPPTEVFIDAKLSFYKERQRQKGRDEARFVESIKINLADELGIFWNNHAHISKSSAQAHIDALSSLTPSVDGEPSSPTETMVDLDTPDELAVRSILLGICYRTLGDYVTARRHLTEAYTLHPMVKVSTWIGGMSLFEIATLDLMEVESSCHTMMPQIDWEHALADAELKLDTALALSPRQVDLSSRLDSRTSMLKEEVRKKREMCKV